jgi:hypothetical protein
VVTWAIYSFGNFDEANKTSTKTMWYLVVWFPPFPELLCLIKYHLDQKTASSREETKKNPSRMNGTLMHNANTSEARMRLVGITKCKGKSKEQKITEKNMKGRFKIQAMLEKNQNGVNVRRPMFPH